MDIRIAWRDKLIRAVSGDQDLSDRLDAWLDEIDDADVGPLAAGLLAACASKAAPSRYMLSGLKNGYAMEVAEKAKDPKATTTGWEDARARLAARFGTLDRQGPLERARRERAVRRFWSEALPRVVLGVYGDPTTQISTERGNVCTLVRETFKGSGEWETLDGTFVGAVDTYDHPVYPNLEYDALAWHEKTYPQEWPSHKDLATDWIEI